jgi:aspartate aminotransferase
MFSDRAINLTPSATVELNAKVAQLKKDGIDIIKLNIGEPDFGTPENIKRAAKQAIDEEFTKYTPVPGIPELRQAICHKLKAENGIDYQPNEICVSTGAKQALINAVLVIAQAGDEVIIPTPCWVSYEEMVRIAGAEPVLVPVSQQPGREFDLDIAAIEKAVTPRTRAIIINTPNNPTGAVYLKETLEQLVELAVRYELYIITDEVYEKLLYNGAVHVSVASLSPEARKISITVNGLSKSYAMTGWRIGYVAADRPIVAAISGIQGHMTSCASSIAQRAALEALTGPQKSVEVMREEFSRRRNMMYSRLKTMPGITCSDANGAFYLLPDISAYYGKRYGSTIIRDSCDMANFLLDQAHIAVVPGASFRAPDCLRLSYSNSMENLQKGLDRFEEALSYLK